jgi:DNA ligase-1
MRAFTDLYMALDQTTRTSEKLAALVGYFRAADARDAAWGAYLLSGRKIGKSISSKRLRDWAAQAAGYPLWLVEESYEIVGDLSETISLLIPPADVIDPPPLHVLIEQTLLPLGSLDAPTQQQRIADAWRHLSTEQRLVFHKLLGGNFRVGVSKNLLIRALAEVAGVEAAVIAHRLAGKLQTDAAAYHRLVAPAGALKDDALPYPFMLAHPIDTDLPDLGEIAGWQLEWKFDGIRAQIVRRGGQTMVWSRGDEMISGAFPELSQFGACLPDGTVLDGEIIACDGDRPLPFAELQQRLNRKSVEPSFWPAVPVRFIAFDLLESEGQDLRSLPLMQRREHLEKLLAACDAGDVLGRAEPIGVESWDAAHALLSDARDRCVEGIMLKRRDSAYEAGRVRGSWWKLKVQPYTIDAVLIAAEPGRGKRAGLLTDYTFGVWDSASGSLVPVAKACSGLTDKEIVAVDRFARNHTTGRFGPVRSVEASLVFEIGFEAIARSTRHKSGIALRFPRMLRWRSDKKPAEADTLASLQELLARVEVRR